MTTDLIKYALEAYSFVLPRNGQFSFAQWANYVSAVFDCNRGRNGSIHAALMGVAGTVKRINGETIVSIR